MPTAISPVLAGYYKVETSRAINNSDIEILEKSLICLPEPHDYFKKQ
jgi:hypothetical protein